MSRRLRAQDAPAPGQAQPVGVNAWVPRACSGASRRPRIARSAAPPSDDADCGDALPCHPMQGESSDEELMLAYGRGEVRAFESLYGRHRGTLYRFLMRQLGDRAAADEIFQEVWSRVIAVRERYRPEAKFTTWLLQIAHNLVVDLHRRQRPQVGAAEAEALFRNLDAPEEQRPERVLGEFDQRRRLQRALEDMPAEQREAFVMRMEWGLGLEDIAAATGAGHETVKSRLRYALAKIRQRFSE